MKIGKVELSDYEYMIVYEDEDGSVNTYNLPSGSFQMNYKSMVNRGVKILNVYHRMNTNDLLNAMLK